MTDTSSTGYAQDIKEFLAKPQLMATGVLTVTDTVTTFPSYVLPEFFLSNPLISRKVEGYYGIRATIVIRLQVNATRFQQGRYRVVAVPLGGASQSDTWIANYARMMTTSVVQRTTAPGVELDLACDSIVELKLPFISARSATLVKGGTTHSAVWWVRLFPYVPLVAGSGDNTAGYSMWAHMEDVELMGVAIPQSGIRTNRVSKNATDAEQEASGLKPISSGLSLISKGMSSLSMVPLLSSVAAPASWVMDVASKAAWSLGYSKPANLAPQHKVIRSVNSGFANADEVDNSSVLAYTSRNSVQPLPGFAGTDVDEMSVKYVAGKFAFYEIFAMNDAQPAGTVLWATPTNPGTFTRAVSGGPGATAFTPLAFASKFFMYYRGSIKFRIKIVKTEFHSGRLLVAFSPRNSEGTTSSPTIFDTQYLHRQVVDIRNNNEFEIVVPYVALESYLLSADSSDAPMLYFYVLDPLVAPSTVNNAIAFLVEVAGGDDIEFQVPQRFNAAPVLLASYQMGDSTECGFASTSFGGKKTDDILSSSACIGEHVTSFRQLLKVPCFCTTNDSNNGSFSFAHFSPFTVNVGHYVAGTYTITYTYPDLYSILGSCYALHRGSVRIKMIQSLAHTFQNATDNALAYYQPAAPDFADWVFNVTTDRFGNADARGASNVITQPFITTLNNGIEITVPQYSRTHSRAVGDHIVSPSSVRSRVQNSTTLDPFTLVVDRCAGAGAGYYFARCGGDDLEFGMFISVPILAVGVIGQL